MKKVIILLAIVAVFFSIAPTRGHAQTLDADTLIALKMLSGENRGFMGHDRIDIEDSSGGYKTVERFTNNYLGTDVISITDMDGNYTEVRRGFTGGIEIYDSQGNYKTIRRPYTPGYDPLKW